MRHVKIYFKPVTIEEASAVLRQYGESARCLAGGAWVATQNDPDVEYLVDISYCRLNEISEQDGQLRIGACVTLEDLCQSEQINGFASGILAEVARWTGSLQLRNSTTVGGSIVLKRDLALPLLALDAQLVIVGEQQHTVPLAECYASGGEFLRQGDVIKECLIPSDFKGATGKVQRMSRTRQDGSLISVVAVMQQERCVCQHAQLAVAPVTTGMSRLPNAEALLAGQTVTPTLIQQVVESITQDVTPVEDFRASAEYRRKMLGVYAKRVISACCNV